MLLATEWPHYRELDPEWAGRLVERRTVVDARWALSAEDWRACGWELGHLYQPAGMRRPMD